MAARAHPMLYPSSPPLVMRGLPPCRIISDSFLHRLRRVWRKWNSPCPKIAPGARQYLRILACSHRPSKARKCRRIFLFQFARCRLARRKIFCSQVPNQAQRLRWDRLLTPLKILGGVLHWPSNGNDRIVRPRRPRKEPLWPPQMLFAENLSHNASHRLPIV